MLIRLRNYIIPGFIRNLKKSEKGTILIEFAFVFPVTMMLFMGGFETFRLLMAYRKTNMTVMSVGNLISQNKNLDSDGIENIFTAVKNIMEPLDLGTDGQVFVSYVTGIAGGDNIINLQCKGTQNASQASKIGIQGDSADLGQLPGNFTIDEFETVVISEVVYRYEPIFLNLSTWMKSSIFASQDVYNASVQKPRFTEINFINGCP